MTTTKPKAPTPQGISALLTDAGFELGVDADGYADGYKVIPNRPGDGIVLVTWWGPNAALGEMLIRYACAIEAAGYHVRQSGGNAYLVVTGQPVTAPSGAKEDK